MMALLFSLLVALALALFLRSHNNSRCGANAVVTDGPATTAVPPPPATTAPPVSTPVTTPPTAPPATNTVGSTPPTARGSCPSLPATINLVATLIHSSSLINLERLATASCSRNGKGSLVVGAFEPAERAFEQYVRQIPVLPFDHHMLAALVASNVIKTDGANGLGFVDADWIDWTVPTLS
ncbi:unnamed protein product [Cyclocybe aegerita]|uniref:FAS1 domain-containing protein n=1 Tax=Cyclocybe aegerita TaxID=1973307 RepID=A0A8S0WBP7_CYCAE|nr:unnamed protein product [Cyclocybe aegerita]